MPITALSVVDQLSASMSHSSLRNELIASNIANRDTPGYRRLQLQFDRALDQAGVVASIVVDTSGHSASLEDDLTALSTNTMKYQAMARVLSRYFSIVNTISNPNRG